MSAKVKVCSFNLRIDNESDGVNKFTNRTGRIKEVIDNEAPDIIGFQEMKDGMFATLLQMLPEYTFVGCGRNKDYRGESTRIALKRDKFEIISSETFWLSNTPDVAGSTFGEDQSGCPRIMTVAKVKPIDATELLLVCNTHLDHKGVSARLLGASHVMQYISDFDEKFVLTGDFNAKPDEASMRLITGVIHKGRKVVDLAENTEPTFHGFGARPEIKIDYIFSDAEPIPDSAKTVIYPPIDGVYVSDHHPVIAEIILE